MCVLCLDTLSSSSFVIFILISSLFFSIFPSLGIFVSSDLPLWFTLYCEIHSQNGSFTLRFSYFVRINIWRHSGSRAYIHAGIKSVWHHYRHTPTFNYTPSYTAPTRYDGRGAVNSTNSLGYSISRYLHFIVPLRELQRFRSLCKPRNCVEIARAIGCAHLCSSQFCDPQLFDRKKCYCYSCEKYFLLLNSECYLRVCCQNILNFMNLMKNWFFFPRHTRHIFFHCWEK